MRLILALVLAAVLMFNFASDANARRAHPSKHRIFYVCAEGFDGYPVVSTCVKDRWP